MNRLKLKDIIGREFGLLTVVGECENNIGKSRFVCNCKCGKVKEFYSNDLKSGNVKSCGCLARKPVDWERLTCNTCGNKIVEFTRNRKNHYHETKRIYCSRECSLSYQKKVSSKALSERNKKYASARMRVKNPSFSQITLEKIKKTKQINGTWRKKPIVQGGNGRELPLTIRILNEHLKWEPTFIVPTKLKSPYPCHYKLELAFPRKKIYIEVDGNSSYSRKPQMEKKQELLENMGWTCIRFKNKEVLNDLENCLSVIRKYL